MMMQTLHEPLYQAAIAIRLAAAKGVWEGKDPDTYFFSCGWYLPYLNAKIFFMRESGYHSSGWWKNPLYERCYHLSLSFDGNSLNHKIADKIITELFGSNKKYIWTEAPYSKAGKHHDVWHYRLFTDENWKPIAPVGEVYSTQFTERGWKSFSELNSSKNES